MTLCLGAPYSDTAGRKSRRRRRRRRRAQVLGKRYAFLVNAITIVEYINKNLTVMSSIKRKYSDNVYKVPELRSTHSALLVFTHSL